MCSKISSAEHLLLLRTSTLQSQRRNDAPQREASTTRPTEEGQTCPGVSSSVHRGCHRMAASPCGPGLTIVLSWNHHKPELLRPYPQEPNTGHSSSGSGFGRWAYMTIRRGRKPHSRIPKTSTLPLLLLPVQGTETVSRRSRLAGGDLQVQPRRHVKDPCRPPQVTLELHKPRMEREVPSTRLEKYRVQCQAVPRKVQEGVLRMHEPRPFFILQAVPFLVHVTC